MTILCGTDFSEASRRAVDAAAHVAARRRVPLRLVTVLDVPGAEEVLARGEDARVTAFFQAERARLGEQLRAEAQRVEPVAGKVATEVVTGRADEGVLAHARAVNADLIVVAAVGRRGDALFRLGSTADRIAQASRVPVLVVRDAAPFTAWMREPRALRLLVGVDATPTSDAALRWSATLASGAPCVVHAAHVFWPPELRERTQGRSMLVGEGDLTALRELETELRARIAAAAGQVPVALRLVGGLGRPADHLAQVATEEASDVIVIGTHQRTGGSRLWHGSVSHDAIVRAPTNVVVVPTN